MSTADELDHLLERKYTGQELDRKERWLMRENGTSAGGNPPSIVVICRGADLAAGGLA